MYASTVFMTMVISTPIFFGPLLFFALSSIAIVIPPEPPAPTGTPAPEGINCHGSSDRDFGTQGAVGSLVKYINGMSDSTTVGPGIQIACVDGGITSFRGFPQNTATSVSGSKLKVLANDIQAHGMRNLRKCAIGLSGDEWCL